MSNIPDTPFDPKAREAMRKILDIAREADLFLFAIVGAREHIETRFRFPTWSVAQYEERGGMPAIRFKAKAGVTDPRDVAHTRNILNALALETGKISLSVIPLCERLDREIGGTTESGPHTPAPPWDYR